jgi:hypothetical protein
VVVVGVLVEVAVGVAEGSAVVVGGSGTPREIVTTKPLAVAESIVTDTPFGPLLNVSPTSHRAPASPVRPLPSTSITCAGIRRVVSTS